MKLCFSKIFRSSKSSQPLSSIRTDDIFQQFYHRYSSLILLVCFIVIKLREWSINSVDCSLETEVPLKQNNLQLISSYHLNDYCKLYGRFYVNYNYVQNQCLNNKHQFSPNATVITEIPKTLKPMPEYQWFGMFYFLFALLLRLPHLIWKHIVRPLIEQIWLRQRNNQQHDQERNLLTLNVNREISLPSNCLTSVWFILIKLFNIAIVVGFVFGQTYLLKDLNSSMEMPHNDSRLLFLLLPKLYWNRFGHKQYCSTFQANSIDEIFPKSTLCPYDYNGQILWVKCLMPINLLLEHLLLALWIWFVLIMGMVITLDLAHHGLLLSIRNYRRKWLTFRSNGQWTTEAYRRYSQTFGNYLISTLVWIYNGSIMIQCNYQQIPMQIISSDTLNRNVE